MNDGEDFFWAKRRKLFKLFRFLFVFVFSFQ